MELLKNVGLILKISSPLFHVEPGDKLSKPYPSHYPSSLLNFSLTLILLTDLCCNENYGHFKN